MEDIKYELKELEVVTNKSTWTVNDFVFGEGTGKSNPVCEFSNKVIIKEIVNIIINNKVYDWELIHFETYYTKDSPFSKGLAGQFWLGLKLILKRAIEV